jgi:hypothetical protein
VWNWRLYERALVQSGRRDAVAVPRRPGGLDSAAWQRRPVNRAGSNGSRIGDRGRPTNAPTDLSIAVEADTGLRSILTVMGAGLDASHHSTLFRRSQLLNTTLHNTPAMRPLHPIIDSTGLSVLEAKGSGPRLNTADVAREAGRSSIWELNTPV